MNDATEVSLETDRLEQLLEAPAPAAPVVMIQYRDRGIPWWVFVPLLFVVPIVTIVVYHHSVVERYRAQAAEATHFVETWAETARNTNRPMTNPTTGLSRVSPPEAVAAAGPQPAVAVPSAPGAVPPAAAASALTVSAADTAASTSPGVEGLKVADATGPGTKSGETGAKTAGAAADTATAGVRSEPAAGLAAGTGATATPGASPVEQKAEVLPKTESDGIARKDVSAGPSGGSLTAADQPPRSRVHSNFPSPFEPENHPAASTGESVDPVAPERGPSVPVAPVSEPLPSKEEMERQIAEESTRKEIDLAEERAGRAAGIRAMRYEDRVKFHQELREILETHGKDSGKEIDKLARRFGRDYNGAAYARARTLWRSARMTQRAKVNAVRSLDIPEPAILDFMSDNLYGRIRMPGGPRNENEVRIRAAQLLLSYELPAAPTATAGAAATPDLDPLPARKPTPPETDGLRPQ